MEIKTLKINGFEYDVKYFENLDKNFVGNIDVMEAVISIEKHSTKGMLMTLLHEAVHGILFSAGFEKEEEHDERLINALAHGIYTLIKDNPELVRLIQEEG